MPLVFMQLPCKVAARVPHGSEAHTLQLQSILSSSDLRTLSPAACLAVVAAEEALNDAQWRPTDTELLQNTGVAIGQAVAIY